MDIKDKNLVDEYLEKHGMMDEETFDRLSEADFIADESKKHFENNKNAEPKNECSKNVWIGGLIVIMLVGVMWGLRSRKMLLPINLII